MISRSGMGKQLSGNRVRKMAGGGSASKDKSAPSKGSASASKSSAAKGSAKPAQKSGGSAAGKTINTSSVKSDRSGGGGMMARAAQAVRNAFGGDKKFTTVTDPKTGQSFNKPSYGAFSMKGLTSNDPANVARNRAAAARYAAIEANRPQRSDAEERRSLERRQKAEERMKGANAGPVAPTTPQPIATTYVPPPPGYRPGIDPEWNAMKPVPIGMSKGGPVKPKRKK